MFSVQHLAKPAIATASLNHETYKHIWRQCVEHIKLRHSAGCGETLWMIPQHVLGRPPYTYLHAIRYVSDKLRAGGFGVSVLAGGVIHIKWAQQVASQVKTCMGPSSSSEKKKKTKKAQTKEEPLSVRLERLRSKLKLI